MSIIPVSPYNNILDYIHWRGDIPVSAQFPLNEIDHLILSRFAYMAFSAIGYGEIENLGNISAELAKLPDKKFLLKDDKRLAIALAKSVRFKNFFVTDIVINSDPEHEKQFGAVSILLPENEIHISYLGTDDSINGWKEDFNMTFMEAIPSQLDGLKYLQHIAKKYPRCKIRIGGHSKGGNIAMFAALSADEEIQNRIICVNNYDGPGFDHDRIQFHKTPQIISKITTYFPQESMIGRLLDHEEKSVVIESVETALMQHDIYSWCVDCTKLVPVKDVKQVRYVFNKSIRKLLDECTLEQRKLVINTIHEAIISANFKNLSEIRKDPIRAFPPVFRAYKSNTTPEERKQISAIVKEFAKNYYEIYKSNDKEQQRKNVDARKNNRSSSQTRRRAAEQNGEPLEKPFF